MEFTNPFALFFIIPFLFLLFFLKKLEKKRYLNIPTGIIVRRISKQKRFVKKCGPVLWVLSAVFLVIALAGPRSVTLAEKIYVEGRVMIASVDLSTSMSGTSSSSAHRPSIDVIKELLQKFVKRRATTDLMGITAYGGNSSGRKNGEAAVIVFPTSELAQLEASISMLKPRLLGGFTSIGEGLLISTLSCLDYDKLQLINIPELIKSLDSEEKAYALDVVAIVGSLKNHIIILFTDGKNNAGIEPYRVLWLDRMLEIKVYFASLESTGATGLSKEEEEKQKNLLIEGVVSTGGIYSEMNIVENVESFFDEVDRLETARLEFGEYEKMIPFYRTPLLFAIVLICVLFALENRYPRIQ